MDELGPKCRVVFQANPEGLCLRQGGKRGHVPSELADATLPRKSSKELSGYPYRKPTQVGEEKILRRK